MLGVNAVPSIQVKDKAVKYETALKTCQFLLIAHGTAARSCQGERHHRDHASCPMHDVHSRGSSGHNGSKASPAVNIDQLIGRLMLNTKARTTLDGLENRRTSDCRSLVSRQHKEFFQSNHCRAS